MTKSKNLRNAALIRFSLAITVLNLLGHFYLGFEQPWIHPLIALATAYAMELIFETILAHQNNIAPKYKGGFKNVILFLLPAHITGLAVSMLLFAGQEIIPIVFATSVAIISKYLLKIKVNKRVRHFLNPSNTGIAVTLILFPRIGIAPPYMFTENLFGVENWIFPIILIGLGSLLNFKYTKKMPLILAWLGGFFLQAVIRNVVFGTPIISGLLPMTGVAFLLFTFYMVSDPATTPFKMKNQIFFGLSVAMIYGILMLTHVVFGLFFSLLITCVLRGAYFYILDFKWNPKSQHGTQEGRPVTNLSSRLAAVKE